MYQASLLVLGTEGESLVATHSGIHSEAQSGSWSADRGARIVERGSWSADRGVQLITPAGPRQSLLLAKDPDQLLKTLYTEEYVPKPASPNSLKLV